MNISEEQPIKKNQLRVLDITVLNSLAELCHANSKNAGWYTDLKTGKPLERNTGEMLMLMVSEISEAMEGERKNLMDDKLPHRKMAEVEMADVLIRVFDFCGYRGYDIGRAVAEKINFNLNRPDHKLDNRKKEGGKIF